MQLCLCHLFFFNYRFTCQIHRRLNKHFACYRPFEILLSNYNNINYIVRYNCQQRVFHWQFLISDIFSASLKFTAFYITDQCGDSRKENAILCSCTPFPHFLLLFIIKFLLLLFSFLFLMKYQIFATVF